MPALSTASHFQEFANPRVGPHLHFYPQDAGQELSESWQAVRWLRELDPSLATPMIRQGNRDFYTFEPTTLLDQSTVMPLRWFIRLERQGEKVSTRFFGQMCRLEPIEHEGSHGYLVHEWDTFDVDARQLAQNFCQMKATFKADGYPDPSKIVGMYFTLHYCFRISHSDPAVGIRKERAGPVHPWTYSKNPVDGNDWRAKARGARVVSFLMWLYCDDTSGNLSKKWNKLNSFLWTAAGLPRSISQRQYNVHFIATSNKAPPLEMLDGIVDQLQ